MDSSTSKPVLIVGAGISGLLLAQHFRSSGVPFRVYERDVDSVYRGVGWGLSLHWSLPALRSLLPEDLAKRLPDAYVDRLAVSRGETSLFPFFDLSTGELKASTPKAPESDRVRVTRQRLRQILATGIDIEWGKAFSRYESDGNTITAYFEDGSSAVGGLLVGCDGNGSRVRRQLFPGQHEQYPVPVKLMGVKVGLTPEQIEPIRKLDPFFLQGASSKNDSFIYCSILDAPGSNEESTDKYSLQIVLSWPYHSGFLDNASPTAVPPTNEARLALFYTLARTYADPFRALLLSIPPETEVKTLDLSDWPPPNGLHSTTRAVLMGDAFHTMTMYRGEGANHSILDVEDFAKLVTPHLGDPAGMGPALRRYENEVVSRARPGVLASRRACLDGHDWSRINKDSPLLTRRQMKLEFDEE